MGVRSHGKGALGARVPKEVGSHSCKVLRSRNLGRILLEAVRGRCVFSLVTGR